MCSATNIRHAPPPFPNNFVYLLNYFDERVKTVDERLVLVDERKDSLKNYRENYYVFIICSTYNRKENFQVPSLNRS
jgi:hypothetical protein